MNPDIEKRIAEHAKRRAEEHFKKVNPHLDPEYFLQAGKSMTIDAYRAGFEEGRNIGKLEGMVEAIEYCDADQIANLKGVKSQIAALLEDKYE